MLTYLYINSLKLVKLKSSINVYIETQMKILCYFTKKKISIKLLTMSINRRKLHI